MNRTKKNDLGRKYAESETKKEGFPFRHWKVIAFYLVLYDIVAVNFSYFFGLLIRFDLQLLKYSERVFKRHLLNSLRFIRHL